jgi:hypothetical protein
VQNLLSYRQLSKNAKIKINIHNYNFPYCLGMGDKTWSFTLREEQRLRVLWKISGYETERLTEARPVLEPAGSYSMGTGGSFLGDKSVGA